MARRSNFWVIIPIILIALAAWYFFFFKGDTGCTVDQDCAPGMVCAFDGSCMAQTKFDASKTHDCYCPGPNSVNDIDCPVFCDLSRTGEIGFCCGDPETGVMTDCTTNKPFIILAEDGHTVEGILKSDGETYKECSDGRTGLMSAITLSTGAGFEKTFFTVPDQAYSTKVSVNMPAGYPPGANMYYVWLESVDVSKAGVAETQFTQAWSHSNCLADSQDDVSHLECLGLAKGVLVSDGVTATFQTPVSIVLDDIAEGTYTYKPNLCVKAVDSSIENSPGVFAVESAPTCGVKPDSLSMVVSGDEISFTVQVDLGPVSATG